MIQHRLGTTFHAATGAAILAFLIAGSAGAQYIDAPGEQELIAVLQTGEPAAKALACKQLAIHGTKDAVPELAKLLTDERLASWSRIALEAIPDPACDEALRDALDSLEGNLLVGAINSIGVRRAEVAVEPLTRLLKSDDANVASSAAVALGHIGGTAAATALQEALAVSPAEVRPAVAEGCILCAERWVAEGKLEDAVAIYDEVRNTDLPKQPIVSATRGAILARKSEGVPLLLEQLRSNDTQMVYIALTTARELAGDNVAQQLAEELGKLAADRAALLIYALADREESVLPDAVFNAARQGEKQVRLAAIEAIGRVVDGSSLSLLLELAGEQDTEVSQAAKTALANLSGENVDAQITAKLIEAEGRSLAALIEVVGQRRIEATDALVKALKNPDSDVRHAALQALGSTVAQDDLKVLIDQVVTPQSPADGPVAQQALLAASVRMPDRDAASAALASAMDRAPNETKAKLLEIIGAVGGAKSLEVISEAVQSNNDELQDVGTRVLGEWLSLDAAPVLLDLTEKLSDNRYHVRTVRGYIRLARQFSMPDAQRAEMCRNALAAARRIDEQRLVLAVLERYPSIDTLKVAVEAAKIPELREEATSTAMSIAEKIEGNREEERALLDQLKS